MIWFFERSGEETRITTRFDNATSEYVVELEWPNRPAELERYADHAEFERRVQALHFQLLESHWVQAGPPAIFADGWRGPTTSN